MVLDDRKMGTALVSGGLGGMLVTMCLHPLDTVKVHMMTSKSRLSVRDTARHILSTQGIRGLYAGVSVPLVTTIPLFSAYYVGMEVASHYAQRQTNQQLLSVSALIPAALMSAPLEYIKLKMQFERYHLYTSNRSSPKYLEGSFYRGWFANFMRDLPISIAYVSFYLFIRSQMAQSLSRTRERQGILPFLMQIGELGAMGVLYLVLTVPVDVINTKYHLRNLAVTTTTPNAPRVPVPYRDIIRETFAQQGVGGFFRGFGPSLMLRLIPVHGVCLIGALITKKVMDFYQPPHQVDGR